MAHSLYGEEFRGMRQARPKAGQRIRRCRKNCYHSSGSIRSARSRVYGCTKQLLHQYWKIPGTYFGNFIPGMVLEIWLMIPARSRGRRGCCARSSSHSDKSLAANLWPSDLLWFFFSRTVDSRLRFSRIRIHGRRIREAPTISRGKHFAIKRVEVA